jgi:fluoride exporter
VERLLLVCLAGGLGSGLRYVLVGWATRMFGGAWPYGVFIVNVIGSFLLGLVAMVAVTKLGPSTRAIVGAGFLGGLTTYSAFNQDTITFLEKKMYAHAAGYVAVMLVACLAAGGCGVALARRI